MKNWLLLSIFCPLTILGQENFVDLRIPPLPVPPTMEVPAPLSPEEDLSENALVTQESMPSNEFKTEEAAPQLPHMQTIPESIVQEATAGTGSSDINIGLSQSVRQQVVDILYKLLSDEFVLYTKTLKFHWNVKGIVFHDFHALFKEQYEALFEIVDNTAERTRALGYPSPGSLQEFSALTQLKELNGDAQSPVQMIKTLLADHEAIIRELRAGIDKTAALGDQGTSNFLQELIVKHEKLAWMLRSTAAQE